MRLGLVLLWLLSSVAWAEGYHWQAVVAPEKAVLGDYFSEVPRFSSINQALLALAKADSRERRYIAIAPGEYYEKVTIETPHLTLVGVGEAPRIFFDAYAGMAGHFHPDGWGTPGSATLTVRAAGIELDNLHIENTFDFLTNDARASDDPKRIKDAQAVALLIDGPSDNTVVRNSRIDGYQDTLFVDAGQSQFINTRISGNVDFIFGSGFAAFINCEIVSRPRGRTFSQGSVAGHITAPSTSIHTPWGLVFINSKLLREDGVADNSVSLGRPWHPTTTFDDGRYADPAAVGSALYINTWMDAHILPEGWASMAGTAPDGSRSLLFTPAQSRFYEHNSQGPGAHSHPERRALPSEQWDYLKKILSIENLGE